MTTLHLLEDGDRADARAGLQQGNHLGIKELGQRIWPSTASGFLLLGGQTRIVGNPVSRGGADPGASGGHGDRIGQSELHEQPHLAIVDVAAGHGGQILCRKNPTSIPDRPRSPTAAPTRAPPPRRGRELPELRPETSRPNQFSHLD